MSTRLLLTIAVPTYNRAGCLSFLLTALQRELVGLEDRVGLIVGDNASTDATPEVTSALQAALPTATVLRHAINVGAEENSAFASNG